MQKKIYYLGTPNAPRFTASFVLSINTCFTDWSEITSSTLTSHLSSFTASWRTFESLTSKSKEKYLFATEKDFSIALDSKIEKLPTSNLGCISYFVLLKKERTKNLFVATKQHRTACGRRSFSNFPLRLEWRRSNALHSTCGCQEPGADECWCFFGNTALPYLKWEDWTARLHSPRL